MSDQVQQSASPAAEPNGGAAGRGWRPYLWREPAAIVPWLCATTSIGSLLLYLTGMVELVTGAKLLLLPGLAVLGGVVIWAKRQGKAELHERLVSGCWAGLVATFFYDVVRVPVAMAGVPVFKAISYFGTVFLGQPSPTLTSEIVGWSYHLSNGVGFALMYALCMARPLWWTAVLWGLTLEGVMLLTPYAEVFGYRISRQFLGMTVGAHVAYGLGLWAALKFRAARMVSVAEWPWLRPLSAGLWLALPLGLTVIAADFYARHARSIPPSPPDYLGPHLYTTWDVLEPDRVAALWVQRRFVDPQARFHFLPPFSRILFGKPFDTPEAEVRRTGTKSATEVLLAQHGLEADPKLSSLARMTHLCEITPWLLPSDRAAHQLAQGIKDTVELLPGGAVGDAAQRVFAWLDAWHEISNPASGRHMESLK
jgi:hypothetical protein